MANISSGANGPWSSPSTWTGGVVPGAADNVTIAGHIVTIDQNVSCINFTTQGSGYVQFVGTTSYTFTSTGTTTMAAGAGAMFWTEGSYNANSSLIFNAVVIQAKTSTGTTYNGFTRLMAGSTGTLNITMQSFVGDSSQSGANPAIIWCSGVSSVDILPGVIITCWSWTMNFSPVFYSNSSTGTPAFFIINTNDQPISVGGFFLHTSQSGGRRYVTVNGDFIINSTNTSAGINMSSTEAEVIINGDFIRTNTAGIIYGGSLVNSTTIFNGNIEQAGPNTGGTMVSASQWEVTINGDVIARSTTSNAGVVSSTGATFFLSGNVISEGTTSGFYLANTAKVIVGTAKAGTTHRFESLGDGAAVWGQMILTQGNTYEITQRHVDGSLLHLTEHGAGPTTANVREGATYAVGEIAGDLKMPLPHSVRAGVTYDDTTVGTALADNNDLANITGGQIATLSE